MSQVQRLIGWNQMSEGTSDTLVGGILRHGRPGLSGDWIGIRRNTFFFCELRSMGLVLPIVSAKSSTQQTQCSHSPTAQGRFRGAHLSRRRDCFCGLPQLEEPGGQVHVFLPSYEVLNAGNLSSPSLRLTICDVKTWVLILQSCYGGNQGLYI